MKAELQNFGSWQFFFRCISCIINTMNSSSDLQVVGFNGVVSKQISTEKRFKVGDTNWNYENIIGVSLEKEESSNKLKIKNHLCEMAGNKIKKVTEIIFKKRKYIIEDNYFLQMPQIQLLPQQTEFKAKAEYQKDLTITTKQSDNISKSKVENEQKKVFIFKKRRIIKNGLHKSLQTGLCTKNISKNFCKAFEAFLKNQKGGEIDSKLLQEGFQELNKILPEKRYNNRAIRAIIRNAILQGLFKVFLEREAKNWIKESRIKEKEGHEEAISTYLNFFQKMQIDDSSGSQLDDESESGKNLKENIKQE